MEGLHKDLVYVCVWQTHACVYVCVCTKSWSLTCSPRTSEVGEQNEIWNVSAKNTFIMETFLAKTFQIPFGSSLWEGQGLCSC